MRGSASFSNFSLEIVISRVYKRQRLSLRRWELDTYRRLSFDDGDVRQVDIDRFPG